MQCLADVLFFSARAVCEWSHRWQTERLRDEAGGWLLLAARGWRVFLLFFAWLPIKKMIIPAMLTKTMTAPQPVATSRRAKHGQPVDCKLLKGMEPEWNVGMLNEVYEVKP